MKKNLIKLLSVIFLTCLPAVSVGQNLREKKADHKFDQFEYVDAIEVYKRIFDKGYKSINTLSKLADAYYFKAELKQANKWYQELFDFAKQEKHSLPSEYYYRYSQTLKSVEDYNKADAIMQEFVKLENNDSRARLFLDKKDTYLSEINSTIKRYELKSLEINSEYSDYGSAFLGDKLIFTSARATQNKEKVHKWTNEAFTSLYSSKISSDGSFSEPELFDKSLKSKVNESSAVFTKDGKTMYFTRNNFKKGKKVHNQEYSILLKIYKSELQSDGNWSQAIELPFNSDDFNTAHPALSVDEKELYFVSDRQGSIGESDLYKVSIYPDGSYSAAVNLGSKINTEARETFPFISHDNILYFSSDGRPGLGGLDVYKVKINFDGSFGTVTNVGAPINSPGDDFSFYINEKNRKGLVSSNREEAKGSDDIYFFQVVDCTQKIKGKVFDQNTLEAITDANLVLYDANYNIIEELKSDSLGEFLTKELLCNYKFRIKASKQEYHTNEVSVVLGKEFDSYKYLDIALEPIEQRIEKEDDLFQKLKLDPIYFDFDKFNIRKDAAVELAKIVEVLKMYPQLKIDVRSHTDSRGNDNYNLRLSDKRAKSTINWIINQGIEADRITGKGYGETQLVNQCANNVPCSKEMHQANRRSEFIILDI